MKVSSAIIFLVCAFLILEHAGVGSLKCYVCLGVDECKEPKELECPEKADVCHTAAAEEGVFAGETKDCNIDSEELQKACKELEGKDGGHCKICKEDLCNSAGLHTLSFSVVVLSILLFLFVKTI